MLTLWSPGAGILCSRAAGDLPEDLAPPYLAFLQQVTPTTTRLLSFNDFGQVVNYQTTFRLRLTQAYVQIAARTEAIHVLVGSRMVQLGVQAASLVLRSIVSHGTQESFDAALARVVAERGRR